MAPECEAPPYHSRVPERRRSTEEPAAARPSWTLLSNHGHVLVCISQRPGASLREIGDMVGITERATLSIVNDLVEDGYVERERVGRRNQYSVNRELPLRHPLEREHTVGELLHAIARTRRAPRS
jgi:Winged helix-turn-helix DNA-binding